MTHFAHRHLTGIDHLESGDIRVILDLGMEYVRALESHPFHSDRLAGRVILTLFFENSTRTRTSFDIAARRLGASVVHWDPDTSSLKKGESFIDTILTLSAMAPDAIIIRHATYGAPLDVVRYAACPVINAGDGAREHPTQALLDALAMERHFGGIQGLRVAIVGDIAHSRVAASNMILLKKMGASVCVIAPPALMPETLPAQGVEKALTLEEGLSGADVVMTIRPQKERMDKALIIDQDYYRDYGLTHERLNFASPHAVAMDPGPYLRGVMISDSLADDPRRFLYQMQVSGGVAVRMAVLDLLIRG